MFNSKGISSSIKLLTIAKHNQRCQVWEKLHP